MGLAGGLLRQALGALPAHAAEIHFQLISLEFIDVRAARELVALTGLPARPRLVLHYPPLMLPRLIMISWPEACARIRIEGHRGLAPAHPARALPRAAAPVRTEQAPAERESA